ncbi:hypothetical protein GQ53DRAFT_832910 [Thozetella sp. PMI_491]|nr:hypothetical protein GQ53DRAFT_832910 [Thozetella sp. PMI_491]
MPWTRWDDEDQLFFLPGDWRWDCGALKIRGTVTISDVGQDITIPLECMFFALGWAETSRSGLQYTVVDYRPIDSTVNEITNRMVENDFSASQLRESLRHYNIPMSSSAIFGTSGIDLTVEVSLKANLVDDLTLCLNGFWQVVIAWKMREGRSNPDGKWEIDPIT